LIKLRNVRSFFAELVDFDFFNLELLFSSQIFSSLLRAPGHAIGGLVNIPNIGYALILIAFLSDEELISIPKDRQKVMSIPNCIILLLWLNKMFRGMSQRKDESFTISNW